MGVLPGIFSTHLLTLKCSVYLNLVFVDLCDLCALRKAYVKSRDHKRHFKYTDNKIIHFILSILGHRVSVLTFVDVNMLLMVLQLLTNSLLGDLKFQIMFSLDISINAY